MIENNEQIVLKKSDFDIDYYIDKRKQQVLEALDRLAQALYSDNSYYKRFSDSYGNDYERL